MLKTTLFPHQQATVDFVLKNRCAGDWSDMGTGKSLSCLASIVATGKKAMIVCPPFLVENWLNEIKKHTTLKGCPHYARFNPEFDVFVVPYTQVAKAEDIFKNVGFIGADEWQYLKNLEAQRTQAFHTLFYKYPPEYFVAMSGTPIKNRIPDLYSLLLLWAKWGVKPAITDKYKSFYTFCCRFTNVIEGKYGNTYKGDKNVEELRSYLKQNSIRHKADANLPELSEFSVVASYGDNLALQQAFSEFQEGFGSADVTVKVESAKAKTAFTGNFVKEAIAAGKGPIVVFSDHKKPLEQLELDLSILRVRSVHGDISITRRDEYIKMFQNGQLDVLLGTYKVLSTGHNLTTSNLAIANDLPWDADFYAQAKKRIHRITQDRPCKFIRVVGSTTDELIFKTLMAKIRTTQKVMEEI